MAGGTPSITLVISYLKIQQPMRQAILRPTFCSRRPPRNMVTPCPISMQACNPDAVHIAQVSGTRVFPYVGHKVWVCVACDIECFVQIKGKSAGNRHRVPCYIVYR